MAQAGPERSRYFIEAVERGLVLLALFDAEHPTLSLTELARRSGSVPSTALRLIQTLVDLDFLEELPDSGRYRPSLAALKLGHAALATAPLRRLARPALERLQRATGESVNLAVLVGGDVVLVESLAETGVLSIRLRPGSRFPAYCTAIGKAMLASLRPEELRRRMAGHAFPKLGPNTIASLKQLEAALPAVREQGFAMQDEELAAGLRSVAAPVGGRGGASEAAVGVMAAASRVSLDRLRRELAPVVVGTAAELSAKLRAEA